LVEADASTGPVRVPLILLAHGSRDPRAAEATQALRRAVAAARPGLTVRVAYLDHAEPRVGTVLADVARAGHRDVVVAPLLLTAAYHSRVDVPATLAQAAEVCEGMRIHTADVLGPDPLLLSALEERVDPTADAFVLAAAGSSAPDAVATIRRTAAELGERLGAPCVAAFASASGPRVATAVARLRSAGARRVAVAAYFLAPGLLYDRVVADAWYAGAVQVAEPLRDLPDLVTLVLTRYDHACPVLVGAGTDAG